MISLACCIPIPGVDSIDCSWSDAIYQVQIKPPAPLFQLSCGQKAGWARPLSFIVYVVGHILKMYYIEYHMFYKDSMYQPSK